METKNILLLNTLMVSTFLISFLGVVDVLAQSNGISSPNERLSIVFETIKDKQNSKEGGQLVYSVAFDGKPLIVRSNLGLEFQGQPLLGEDVKMIDAKRSSFEQTYKLYAGKTSHVNDNFHFLKINLKEGAGQGRKLDIEACAYNDAVAFRYIVPEQPSFSEFSLTNENTEFRVSKDATTYALVLPDFVSSYESEYIKIPITSFSHKGSFVNNAIIGLPLLMEMPGVAWLAITEADMKDYSTMYLTNLTQSWAGSWLKGQLAPQVGNQEVCVTGKLPLQTPWRVIQVGDNAGSIMESNILSSLNPETTFSETSWIKPGKAAWNWWSGSIGADGESSFSTETMKYYVDFAHNSGLEYMLIDAGWAVQGDITKMNGRVDIPEVVQYAKSKNVGVWIWIHYRDAIRQMDEAFALYEKWGVKGLKIDFIERDDQDGIDFYYQAAAKAAAHHLMVDFHGSTKPSGMSRTFPNIMGYEGVVGMEVSKGSLRDNPDNRLMLPFTRMLGGFMDYTPGGFNNITKEEFEPRRSKPMVMGTRAHHLAMYVVYESPIQMVSDYPDAYKGQSSFQFIMDVPATWDETKVLNGIPGEYIIMARRKGDNWFLGSMTNWNPRELNVALDFLPDGPYLAEIYMDAPDSGLYPKNTIIKRIALNNKQQLELSLATGGGCAVRFSPVDSEK